MSARSVLAKRTAHVRADISLVPATTAPHPSIRYTPFVFNTPSSQRTTMNAFPSVTTTTQTPFFLRDSNPAPTPVPAIAKGVPKSPPTKDDEYKIVLVLDESGSMSSVKSGIIDSINDLIRQQKTIKERPTLFTLIKFNGYTTTVKQNSPFDQTDFISNKDYNPDGGTALYDAIGDTIDAYEAEKNVLMVIVTDGEENASNHYKKTDIIPKIDKLKADTDKGWSFVYIGCDLATAKQGYGAGFDTCSNSCNYRANGRQEMCAALGAVSKGISAQRVDEGATRGYGIFQSNLQATMP